MPETFQSEPEPWVVVVRGGSILVDERDVALACEPGWAIYGCGYVRRTLKGRRTETLHRIIAGTPRGMVTDHVDCNPLNNTRANLRVCTQRENALNRTRPFWCGRRYRGVQKESRHRWSAAIATKGRQFKLGSFDNPEDAARAYDDAARKLHGEFARLNFPREGEQCAL